MHVRVAVKSSARRESLEETKKNTFSITVREKAERGEANDRVRALLARHFRIPVSAIRFVSGARSTKKTFDVVR